MPNSKGQEIAEAYFKARISSGQPLPGLLAAEIDRAIAEKDNEIKSIIPCLHMIATELDVDQSEATEWPGLVKAILSSVEAHTDERARILAMLREPSEELVEKLLSEYMSKYRLYQLDVGKDEFAWNQYAAIVGLRAVLAALAEELEK